MTIEKAIEEVGKYYAKALTMDWVKNKTAWALYQVWKIADMEDWRKENESRDTESTK